jgi:predicted permease
LLQDARFALRALRRDPGFSVAAIATLALGIGTNTALFGVVNGLMLRSLPGVQRPGELVVVSQGDGDDFISISWPVFDHLRRSAATLQDIAAFDVVSMAMADEGETEVLFGLQVSGNYFDVLGVRPAAGRFFAPERAWFPSVEDAVVISHALWLRRFGGDLGVVGRPVTLSGHPARIVGVAPAGFAGHVVAIQADIYVPIGMPAPEVHGAAALSHPRNGVLETVGRRAPEVDVAAVGAEVAALADAFIKELEGSEAIYPLQTTTYSALPGTARLGATVLFALLMAIVGMLLLITCVNVANMMLARAGARRREIAVRLSVGAGRGRLVRQLLTESLLLSAAAALCGALLAIWLTRLMTTFEPPVVPFPGMRLALDFGFDARVLVFCTALAGATALAFGLLPALRATRPDLVAALKDGAQGDGPHRARLRALLVAGQMAVTVLLLLASGLFLRALQAAHTVDTGFATAGVHVAGFDLTLNGYEPARVAAFYDALLQRSAAIPGARAVALAGKLPLAGASSTSITVPGAEPQGRAGAPEPAGFSLHNQSVSGGYFQVLGTPLLRGRTFSPGDGTEAPAVAVINETMARRFWSLDGAVGRSFELFGRHVTVVGVAADAHYHGLVEETPLFAYFPFRQRPRTDMYLHVALAPGAVEEVLWPALRDVVASIDPEVPVLSAAPLRDALRLHFLPQLLAAWVTGVAGALGLVLGTVGIYGVTAYAASRRLHEIGVRMALGAAATDVRRMMMRQGIAAPLVGMAVGMLAAAVLTRLMQAFLMGVSPLDPFVFGAVAGILAAAAVLATLVPARRAARVDPVITLKRG